jgi:hypothetical protein
MFEKILHFLKNKGQAYQADPSQQLESLQKHKADVISTIFREFFAYEEALNFRDEGDRFDERLKSILEGLDADGTAEPNPDLYSFMSDEDRHIRWLSEILVDGYQPPLDPVKIRCHLLALVFYYKFFQNEIHSTVLIQKIDYALTQLAWTCAVLVQNSKQEGNKSYKRDSQKKGMTRKKLAMQQKAIDLAWRIEKRQDKTRHMMATEIQKLWKKKYPGDNIPVKETIKTYLKGVWEKLNVKS